MSSHSAADVQIENATDLRALSAFISSTLEADVAQRGLALPPNNVVTFSKAARTKDGRIAGGIVGTVSWNALRIAQLAANPDCRVPGTGTALMKCAEEAARGEFACNQIYLATFSWQARPFYEKLGYTLQYTLNGYPVGFAKHYLEKVWPMEARADAVQGYSGAATDLVIEDWDKNEAFDQIVQWIQRDTVARNTGAPTCVASVSGLQAVHADGSLAGGCVFDHMFNSLFIFSFAVADGAQRRGVGTALLRRLVEVAREKKCDFVLVSVRSWEARPFFEKNGFAVVFTQRDHPVGFESYLLVNALLEEGKE